MVRGRWKWIKICCLFAIATCAFRRITSNVTRVTQSRLKLFFTPRTIIYSPLWLIFGTFNPLALRSFESIIWIVVIWQWQQSFLRHRPFSLFSELVFEGIYPFLKSTFFACKKLKCIHRFLVWINLLVFKPNN